MGRFRPSYFFISLGFFIIRMTRYYFPFLLVNLLTVKLSLKLIYLCVCVCVCVMCVSMCVCVCGVFVFLHELVCGDWCDFLFNLVGTFRFVGHGFRVPQGKFI